MIFGNADRSTFTRISMLRYQRVFTIKAMLILMLTAGSREVASKIKEISPRLMASTGGPNTMLTTALTPQVAAAVQMSACIENSGQCTALRHLVAPSCTNTWIEKQVFEGVKLISEPVESVRESSFASLYEGGVSSAASRDGYAKHPSLPAYVSGTLTLRTKCRISLDICLAGWHLIRA